MKRYLLIISIFILLPISGVFATEQIDINSATLMQLDGIVHVGAKTAQKIIDGRPYSSVQDLSKVKGIGNGKYLQDIIAQGFACVNCQTTQIADQTPIPIPAPTPSPTLPPTTIYPTGIVLNEIMPNPEGADETDEWIELYNCSNSDVDLSDWQIQDINGTVTTYTIPKNTKILAGVPAVSGSFLLFKRPETKILLNNDADSLTLLTPDKKIIDSVSFTKAPLGQSYGKTLGSWAWSISPTPGVKNIISTISPKTSVKVLSKTKNSVTNDVVDSGLSSVSGAINKNQEDVSKSDNPWFLFFIALTITIISAVIVLLIKLKFKQHVGT